MQEGLPDAIPVEACYLGWQDSLRNLASLVEPEMDGVTARREAVRSCYWDSALSTWSAAIRQASSQTCYVEISTAA